MTLNIELSYLHGVAGNYNWLGPFIDQAIQSQFALDTRLFINPSALQPGTISDQTNNGQLQDFLLYVLQNSPVRRDARARQEWYVHVLVASFHVEPILGIMYDAASSINSRNGCAIFMSQLMQLAQRDGVPLNELVGRTVLHELGHCLALIHNTDLSLMSETDVLIHSPLPPGWFGNINYRYNARDIDFVLHNPGIVKPGGRIIEQTGTVSDSYLSARQHSGLKIALLNFDLEPVLNFESGDLVSICLRLSNESRKPVRLPFPLSQNSKYLVVTLARPDGETTRLHLQRGCCSGLDSTLLKAGSPKYLSLNLFFDRAGYLFETPGTYRIECFVRTFGKGGGWHSSGLRELNITATSEERREWMRQLYTKKLREHLNGGGFNALFTPAFFQKLTRLQTADAGLAVPLSWLAASYYKNGIALSSDLLETGKAQRKLSDIYDFLSQAEPFAVRRGKIKYEQAAIQALNGTPGIAADHPDIGAYKGIKDALINRDPKPRKIKQYEN